METKSVIVPVNELAAYRTKIEKFNRKAKKNNIDPMMVTEVSDPYQHLFYVDSIRYGVQVVKVSFEYTPIKVGNWDVKAFLNRDSKDVVTITNFTNDVVDYYDVDFRRCDHCNVKHRRRSLVLLQEGNEERVIGRSCVKEYMGLSPSTLDWMMKYSTEITSYDFDFIPNAGEVIYDTLDIMAKAYAVYLDDKKVYHPTSAGEESTAGKVLCNPSYTSEHEEWAEKAIEVLVNSIPVSQYDYNLQNVAKNDFVSAKNIGILASGVKVADKLLSVSHVKKESEYVGAIKERLDFDATVVVVYELGEGFYGHRTMIILEDEDDNVYKWIASGYSDLEVNDEIKIRGTVKEHDEYKGTKQTILTRCRYTIKED